MRAYWKFYRDINLFNLVFCIMAMPLTSLVWFPILFCTLGVLAGMFAFRTFYNQQYYFYNNIGFTKGKLARMTFFINAVVALPVLIVILIAT